MKFTTSTRYTFLSLITFGTFASIGVQLSYAQTPANKANNVNTIPAAKTPIRPGQIFLSGYSFLEEAEAFEKEKFYEEAWNKFHQALRSYKTLQSNYPEWKVDIVDMRIRETLSEIKRIEPKAQKEHLERQARRKGYTEQNTSENDIQSVELSLKNAVTPTQAKATPQATTPQATTPQATTPQATTPKVATPQAIAPLKVKPAFSPSEQRELTRLQEQIKLYRQRIAKLESQSKLEKEVHHREILALKDKIRKANQGLAKNSDNAHTRLLDEQVKLLQEKLTSSEQKSKEQLKQLFALHNKFTKQRADLAAAPLKQDVQRLEQEKLRYEADLDQIVSIHKKHIVEAKKIRQERDRALAELTLTKNSLNEKSKQLEASKEASHKVVTALRNKIKEQQHQIVALEQQVVSLNAENDELRQKVEQTNLLNQELVNELGAVTLERDKLNQLLDLSDAERAKRTIKEALRLGEQVRSQQAVIKQLMTDKNYAQDEIIEWQTKLAVAKQKIINLETENTNYIRRIASLENSLNNTNAKLAKALDNPNSDPLKVKEANVLKKALTRLKAQLVRRKLAEQLLWDEYQKSDIKDASLGLAISNLMHEEITLSADEQKLLQEKEDTDQFQLQRMLKTPAQRQAAIAKSKAQIESLESLALRFVEKGQLLSAKEIYDDAYDTHGEHYPFFINRAVVRYNLQQFSEAEEIFESGTQLRENNAYTHYMLGLSRFQNKKDEQAKKSLERAISLKPDYVDAYVYQGIVYCASRNFSTAKQYLEKAVRIAPLSKEAQYNLAYVHAEMEELPQAVKAYNNALKAGLSPLPEFENRIGIAKINN